MRVVLLLPVAHSDLLLPHASQGKQGFYQFLSWNLPLSQVTMVVFLSEWRVLPAQQVVQTESDVAMSGNVVYPSVSLREGYLHTHFRVELFESLFANFISVQGKMHKSQVTGRYSLSSHMAAYVHP